MKIKSGAEYLDSLRKINPNIYYKGERIKDVTRHPATAPHVRAAAMTYALASDKEYRDLATATSHLTGRTISRFTHIHQGIEDLIKKIKLLRVLETKQFERVGDHQPLSVEVRIITATNKNLQDLIARNQFRDDLFFRINVIPIYLPPLRDRTEDIPLLVSKFIHRLNKRSGKSITGLSRAAMELFFSYHWPGNIRELKSALEYAFVVVDAGLIGEEHLPHQIIQQENFQRVSASLPDNREPVEKLALVDALRQSGGNQSQAARILGINRVTVWNRMKKYGIDLKRVMTT